MTTRKIEYTAAKPIQGMPDALILRWGDPTRHHLCAVVREDLADVALAEFSSGEACSLCMLALAFMRRTIFLAPVKASLVAVVKFPWLPIAEVAFSVEEVDGEFLVRATHNTSSLVIGACATRENAEIITRRLTAADRIRLPFRANPDADPQH
jgi:hypothetical protein